MNRILVIFLLAVMLLQAFGKVLIVMDYQANKEFIMEFLCINRDKPELGCEGKCQLTKKLKAQEEAEKNANEHSQKQDVQLHLFCQNLLAMQLATPALADRKSFAHFPSGRPVQAFYSFFHPPRV